MLDTIKAQITHTAVRMVGATQSDLITALVMSVIFLLLLFVFIFVGISVFSATTTLSTIIDSTLPALAGIGLALRKKDKSKLLKSLGKHGSSCRENSEEADQGHYSLNVIFLIIIPL